MDIKYKRQLLENDLDLNNTLDRFMNNEDLLEKLLVQFLDDKNFMELKKNIEVKDYKEAFLNAHTLKGVSANLGLNSVYIPLVSIVEELRKNKFDDKNNTFKKLEDNYNELCNIIRENSKSLLI